MLFPSLIGAPIKSPTEVQLVVALLVVVALIAAISFGLAWLARRFFFSRSPHAKKYFWIVAGALTAAGLTAFGAAFYVFIA